MNAIKSLHIDQIFFETWNKNNWTIRSVHLVGAAADNEVVQTDGDGFGKYIEAEVEEFHNKYNPEDDVLNNLYRIEQGDIALGDEGAEDGINKPKNYNEENVSKEVIKDTDGDGVTTNQIMEIIIQDILAS